MYHNLVSPFQSALPPLCPSLCLCCEHPHPPHLSHYPGKPMCNFALCLEFPFSVKLWQRAFPFAWKQQISPPPLSTQLAAHEQSIARTAANAFESRGTSTAMFVFPAARLWNTFNASGDVSPRPYGAGWCFLITETGPSTHCDTI